MHNQMWFQHFFSYFVSSFSSIFFEHTRFYFLLTNRGIVAIFVPPPLPRNICVPTTHMCMWWARVEDFSILIFYFIYLLKLYCNWEFGIYTLPFVMLTVGLGRASFFLFFWCFVLAFGPAQFRVLPGLLLFFLMKRVLSLTKSCCYKNIKSTS